MLKISVKYVQLTHRFFSAGGSCLLCMQSSSLLHYKGHLLGFCRCKWTTRYTNSNIPASFTALFQSLEKSMGYLSITNLVFVKVGSVKSMVVSDATVEMRRGGANNCSVLPACTVGTYSSSLWEDKSLTLTWNL
jgi:hypothetical protein